MNKRKSALFSVESNLTLEEYEKMLKVIPEYYWSIMKSLAIRELIFIIIVSLIYQWDMLGTCVFYIIVLLITGTICKVKIEWFAKKIYKQHENDEHLEKVSTTHFYDNYLIKQNDEYERKIKYLDIDKLIETETNFYIQNKNTNTLINIKKSNDNLELVNFLRDINKDVFIDKSNYKQNNLKKITKIHNKQNIEKLLLSLFIITLFSFVGACLSFRFMIIDKPAILSNDYIWVFWLWLPFSVLSIILGFKYKKQGFKCNKNIIAGFIIGVSLLAFGSFSFIFPSIKIEYNNINKYTDILNVHFPNNGILTQEKYDTLFDEDKKNITITQAFYKKTDNINKLEKDIVDGKNWIEVSKLKTNLKVLIPFQLRNPNCESCYYLIFNEDTKEYNKIPNSQGNFHIYVSLYDLDNKILNINDFYYEFKK